MHIESDEESVAAGDTAADGCECISGGLIDSGATCGERDVATQAVHRFLYRHISRRSQIRGIYVVVLRNTHLAVRQHEIMQVALWADQVF